MRAVLILAVAVATALADPGGLCDLKCRRLGCDTLSTSFSCPELDKLGCPQCHGCCVLRPPPPSPPPPPPSPSPSPPLPALSPPPPPWILRAECRTVCRRLTCGLLSSSLSCSELTNVGCDCGGCCSNASSIASASNVAGSGSNTGKSTTLRAIRRVRREVRTATGDVVNTSTFDHKFCCYSSEWPSSYCKVHRTLACANVSCASSPPCRRFCQHDQCSGCAGRSPGEVSKVALRACVGRGAPLNPVCGHSIQYASPCLAQAMCFVEPGAAAPAGHRAPIDPLMSIAQIVLAGAARSASTSASFAFPARESEWEWRNTSSEDRACGTK